jgi:2-amino-4-hydroxy-6-hydroxymethyldihydropteridine diphosphokinase
MEFVYLSLGTNLGQREKNLQLAINEINKIGEIEIISGIYETEPWGFDSENKFLNMVVVLCTNIDCFQLIERCLEIEKLLGRTRSSDLRYESRIIDIDILFFGNKIINEDNLIIPHQYIQNRKFILEPLNEVASAFLHPILGVTVSEILNNCSDKCLVTRLGTIDA